MLQLGHHIYKRRIERRVQQRKIMMFESRHACTQIYEQNYHATSSKNPFLFYKRLK
jgi:hypothetical protein